MWTDILHVIRWAHVPAAARRTRVSLARGLLWPRLSSWASVRSAARRQGAPAAPRPRSSRRRASRREHPSRSGRCRSAGPATEPPSRRQLADEGASNASWNGRSMTPASVSAPTAAPGRSGGTCAGPPPGWSDGRPTRGHPPLRHARRGAGARVRRSGPESSRASARAAASRSSRRRAAACAGASSIRPTPPRGATPAARILNSFLRPIRIDDPPGARYFAGEMLCGVARAQ